MIKNNFGFGFLPVFLVFVALSVVSVAGWTVYNNQKVDKSVTDNKAQTATSPEDVINKIESTYSTKYKIINTDQNNQPKQGEMSVRISKKSPIYKVEGFNFYNDYEGGSTIELLPGPTTTNPLPSDADVAIRNETSEIYKSFGMTKSGTYGNQAEANELDVYTGVNIICTVEPARAPTNLNSASCGAIDQYKVTAEVLKPIAEVTPNLDDKTYFIDLKIENSQVSGYQRASLMTGKINDMGGGTALYYKKTSGQWKFFKETQSVLNCSNYSNNDLIFAFQGQSCYGSNGENLTVK